MQDIYRLKKGRITILVGLDLVITTALWLFLPVLGKFVFGKTAIPDTPYSTFFYYWSWFALNIVVSIVIAFPAIILGMYFPHLFLKPKG